MAVVSPPRCRVRFIADLAITHGEELAYLWGRRRGAIFSETLTLRDLQDLQGRIEAHLQGMLAADEGLLALFDDWLCADDRDEVFAAAWAFLRSGQRAAIARVLDAFRKAEGPRLHGLGDALGAASQAHTEAALRDALTGAEPARAVAAAAALVTRQRLAPDDAALHRLLEVADAGVAAVAWQCVALTDPASATRPLPYRTALEAGDDALRAAAIGAAIWRGEQWLPSFASRLAATGDTLGLGLCAALEDAFSSAAWGDRIAALPGPSRCAMLARTGHPEAIETIIGMMADSDPLTAAAAGTAYTRLTGLDVAAQRRTLPIDANADEFEREFVDDVWLPDQARARQQWTRNEARWRSGRRWCRGHEISSALSTAAQATIDLAARWDFGMRAALAGERLMAPPPVI
ncbi:MAG: hypothetical protein KF710_05375 [Rhodocyclaceae bacterium]|nr:hypothetical protein [Rhodocyclaceae bacterium]